jgi:hypothetical protein
MGVTSFAGQLRVPPSGKCWHPRRVCADVERRRCTRRIATPADAGFGRCVVRHQIPSALRQNGRLSETAISRTSPVYWCWTSGHATVTDDRRSSAGQHPGDEDTQRLSLTKGTASMRASGRSQTRRFAGYTRTTACTKGSQGGKRVSRRSAWQNKWIRAPFGDVPPIFRKRGTKETAKV